MKQAIAILLAALLSKASVAQVAYSFRSGNEGGGAYVAVDDASGRITEQRLLFKDEDCRKAKKVRFTASGKYVGVTSSRSKTPNLFVASLQAGGAVIPVGLPGEPDELRAAGEHYVVTCEGGVIALVSAAKGTIEQTWNGATQASPPLRNAEDLTVLDDGKTVLVSFESEHRLVLLSLPDLTLRGDVKLPFAVPGADIPGSLSSRGPQPEVVLASRRANTLLATLDNFGAVGLLDLDAALEGRVQGAVYLATALDESWGTAYPDRAALFDLNGKPHALVTNVGRAGGAVLVDMQARRIVRGWEVPFGLEKPSFLAGAKMAVATPAGKLKGPDVGRIYEPGSAVYLFDFSKSLDPAQAPVESVPMDLKVFYVKPVDARTSRVVVLAAGSGSPDQVLTFDVARKRVLDRQPAFGAIERLDERPR